MEWVETTGTTVDEAKDAALDQLGVAEDEAEFEVVDEPKSGLFGLNRREARVRARVRPVQPRPKTERRRQRSRGNGKGSGERGRGSRDRGAKRRSENERAPARKSAASGDGGAEELGTSNRDADAPTPPSPDRTGSAGERPPRTKARTPKKRSAKPPREDKTMGEPVSVMTQGAQAEEFLDGLLDAFDLDGDIEQVEIDEETIELRVEGDDLGLLIGPKGQTLQAVQELTRASLQRRADGPLEGRVRIDVGSYRQRRREALERFTRQVAEEVVSDGEERALEAMNAADRKVVHDTVNEIDGVRTISEGEDPRRRVVIIAE